jgi:hypothetical protein
MARNHFLKKEFNMVMIQLFQLQEEFERKCCDEETEIFNGAALWTAFVAKAEDAGFSVFVNGVTVFGIPTCFGLGMIPSRLVNPKPLVGDFWREHDIPYRSGDALLPLK